MCNLSGEIGGERSFGALNMHDLLGIYRTQASIVSETSRGGQPTVALAIIYH